MDPDPLVRERDIVDPRKFLWPSSGPRTSLVHHPPQGAVMSLLTASFHESWISKRSGGLEREMQLEVKTRCWRGLATGLTRQRPPLLPRWSCSRKRRFTSCKLSCSLSSCWGLAELKPCGVSSHPHSVEPLVVRATLHGRRAGSNRIPAGRDQDWRRM